MPMMARGRLRVELGADELRSLQYYRTQAMRATQSRLNHEQQVKVVIRLKPQQSELSYNKCVYLSEQENQLVVSTDNKQEIFVFDHVAHQATSQLDIYRMIGQEAVRSSLEGYNCCLFAYGQTGAGKTYSIMGDINQIHSDFYCQSRGILPRLIQDIFQLVVLQTESTYKITCSYIQIYNQQIFDLLSSDKRVHQIRQDHKKGVFVEGVVERKLGSYKQGIEALLQGDKTRKIAYTSMNTQSSRSHVIFTIMIESEIKEDQLIKVKKSKLNIIDLAGSERVKHTNVEGERLREGCNINKSLHVLGNVINSLVQSTKKKKHIPYRDSKLTYYLKDSLGGNSITKLLANVHCGKEYYGDTISTLMLAKRAKILKTRVQINQNFSENFDSLRKEVKRLRQELAEARYFKDIQKTQRTSFYQDFQQTLQKVTDNSDYYEVAPKIEIIQVFEENQLHYKSLLEIYEEHAKTCQIHGNGRKNSFNMVGQWKNNQKKIITLTNLVKQFPAFTKIYKENLLLKQQKQKSRVYQQTLTQDEKNMSKKITEETTFITIKQPQNNTQLGAGNVQQLVKVYQGIIDQMKAHFAATLQTLQKSYTELQHELKIKEKKIKSLIKAQDVAPDIQQLRNQNEYLQLNILNLENEIRQLKQDEFRLALDKKEAKKTPNRSSIKQTQLEIQQQDQTVVFVLDQLAKIKQQAQRQAQITEKQIGQMQKLISQLRIQVNSLASQNNQLNLKYNRSANQIRLKQMYQIQHFSETSTKKLFSDNFLPCWEEVFPKKDVSQDGIRNTEDKQTQEVTTLRLQTKLKAKQISDLKQQIKRFEESEKKIEMQFGKDISDLIKDYRQYLKKMQPQFKPTKIISKLKQPETQFFTSILPNKVSDKLLHKKSLTDAQGIVPKQTPRKSMKKQVQFNNFISVNNNKPKNNAQK